MPDSAFPDYAYRPDLDVFTVRWPTHELMVTARPDYEALLLLPEARCTTRWLFDVRRRPYTDAASARWVITDWLPRAAALLPAPPAPGVPGSPLPRRGTRRRYGSGRRDAAGHPARPALPAACFYR